MSPKERGILERYANWHPIAPSVKSVDKSCSGCGSCSADGGCGGSDGSCSQCGGCTNAFHPSLGGAGRKMRRR